MNTTQDHRLEDITIGLIYTVFSLFVILCYVPCLIVIRRDKEMQHPTFLMMFHLGLVDLIVLVCQVIAGILLITGFAHEFAASYWANKIFGALADGLAWYSYCAMIHLIAFDRFLTLCLPPKYRLFESFTNTKIGLAICWLYTLLWVVAFLSPYAGFVYTPVSWSFYFDVTKPWYDLVKRVAWWQTFLFLNISALWYIMIVLYLRMKRNQMADQRQQTSVQKKEISILKQASVICIYTLVWDQYWHLAPILFFEYGFSYAFAVGNFLWITNAAVNPLVYLTMNKRISKKVRQMLPFRAGVAPTTAATTSVVSECKQSVAICSICSETEAITDIV